MQNEILKSFLPRNLVNDILRHPDTCPLEREQRFEAVLLFADIGGFTVLSEALAKQGKRGTEELNRLINRYFAEMISLVQSYGGIIAKFGGDSLSVLFPCKPESRGIAVRRGLKCALEMQDQTRCYATISTGVGQFSLTLKAGLSLGPVFCTTVGEAALRLEYVVAGNSLEEAAQAEHHARQGEVVVSNKVLPLGEPLRYLDLGNGFSRVLEITGIIKKSPLQPLKALPAELTPTLAAFLHPLVMERLKSGQSGLIAEHRKVTVLFVAFDGFDYDGDREVRKKLQAYFSSVIRILESYGGYFRQVEMGDKGSKYLALFGAPVAHENDEERAARCVLELWRAASSAGISTRTALNTGQVFCGLVGS